MASAMIQWGTIISRKLITRQPRFIDAINAKGREKL